MIYRITTLILLAFAILFFALHWANLVDSVSSEFIQPNLSKHIKREAIASLALDNNKYNPIFENQYYIVEDEPNTEIKQKKKRIQNRAHPQNQSKPKTNIQPNKNHTNKPNVKTSGSKPKITQPCRFLSMREINLSTK